MDKFIIVAYRFFATTGGSITTGWDADFILVKPDRNYISAIASVYVAGNEIAKFCS